ncbi:MAG: hypothetical protein KatS3mg132_914 [Limisphaera sp.]|nr:MAG: hypothetical protein KatS3mg132_914 [Limisphaera sp.]
MDRTSASSEQAWLRRVRVRLIEESERARFDQLLEQHHYLHNGRLGGRSLRYVAELDGQWVALITFSGAAPHVKARDRKIGWTARQRVRRLHFLVNNSRFLVLPDRGRHPNLASRVLGLCLRRLSRDWQARWGYPVLLVESFVDESRYRGSCYRACGFEPVGLTAGYRRSSRDYYLQHGRPKQLYLRPLHPRALELLRQPRLPAALAVHEPRLSGPCLLRVGQLGSLWELFRQLKDRRRGHGLQHPQAFVLGCAAVGLLMGAGTYEGFAEVARKLSQAQLRALGARRNRRTGRYHAPSASTFFRVIDGVDPAEFDRLVGLWMLGQEPSVLQALALDGKCLRGSGGGEGKPLQLLSLVGHRLRLTLAQRRIEDKSNEIPALQPLLRQLPAGVLEGSLITGDAMHCQQGSSAFVTQELGADYLWGLKGNQSGILERAQRRLPRQFFSPGA